MSDELLPCPFCGGENVTALTNPVAVHANMLRGTIAKPSVEQIVHLYGADVLRAALPAVTAPQGVDALVAALREAERFMEYFAGETGGSFAGSGTPQTCLASIRAAIAAAQPAPQGVVLAATLKREHDANVAAFGHLRRAEAAEARLAKALEALTPSGDTKAAYTGEFHFQQTTINEDGDEVAVKTYVPWTTIKEIMAAIRERAALAPAQPAPDAETLRPSNDLMAFLAANKPTLTSGMEAHVRAVAGFDAAPAPDAWNAAIEAAGAEMDRTANDQSELGDMNGYRAVHKARARVLALRKGGAA